MKLRKIEVVGFKSFADRQLVQVDEHVTGVIGPNGCGKSNIVDAVRWCMGEQSAKHLRGAGMADVIFAGCATRGPAGMAEVTLTLENDGRAVAPGALDLPEIAITRRLFSDGTSEYLINKVPGRLRDITELLMGTGAGTKGYSIIEQGQVGKIVSSKPEERRHLIDEAAGITRFKSQKAAAQRKIEATRTNLLRVNDVVSELEGRLSTLRRQAQKAERYKRYREELRDLELWIASHKFLELFATGRVLQDRREDLSQQVGDLRHTIAARDAQIEAKRAELVQTERRLSEHQQQVYDLDNRVRLLEAEDDYRRREREGLRGSAAQARAEAEAGERGLQGVEEELSQVRAAVRELQEAGGAHGLRGRVEALQTELHQVEARFEGLRHELAAAREAKESATRRLAAAGSRVGSLQEVTSELGARAEAAAAVCEALQAQHDGLNEGLQGAERAFLDAEAEVLRLHERRGEIDRERATLKSQVSAAEVELDTQRAEVHRCRSRLQSLQEIQGRYRGCHSGVQVVMEHREELAQPQLGAGAGGMESRSVPSPVLGILADFVSAPQHLEAAVSAVLGETLEGVVVEEPAVAARGVDLLKRLQEGRTTFLPRRARTSEAAARVEAEHAPGTSLGWSRAPMGTGAIEVVDLSDQAAPPTLGAIEPAVSTTPTETGAEAEAGTVITEGRAPATGRTSGPSWSDRPGVLGRLAELVDVSGELAATARELIGDTLVVEDLARALELWANADRAERCPLVTLDGDRLEPSGVIVGGSPTALDSALLQQKREIRELEGILAELEEAFEATRRRHLMLAERQAEVERAREQSEADVLEAEKAKLARTQARAQLRTDIERVAAELRRKTGERDELGAQATARLAEIEQLRAQIEADEAEVETQTGRVDQGMAQQQEHEAARERIGVDLTEARVALARWQQQADALAATRDRLERQAGSERERIVRLRATADAADERIATLERDTEAAAVQRAQLIEQSKAATARVHDDREQYDELRLCVDELEASLKTLRGDLDEHRERLQQVELGLQEIALERQHVVEDVRQRFDVDVAEVIVDFHHRPLAGVEANERRKELRRILSRLGEVNLTAIEEFEEVSSRYEYLSRQRSDLESAITQLQEAIDRINKTTRQLFRETFEAVDARFQQLFPRLFNGGRAQLRLTDPSDLLSTGVEIEAQPPGKQLRSLDLLSGGEKALTAVSLIFAIFLIKPSPFCILDEVDAPLDDANVGRMCKLVRELASDTQFIMITHNKVTMEASDRLYGVTMEQRGISKLVSVNMRRAVELAYN
ncbi:chromosome segregation protein SMC [Paraliomyxa miuraensis]|uniref:chromosome segregation protein SMC n=1 Tax=Paraliomyxa miuraensis TaxID=376150 RepID=UPI0022542110|nr:chromosome segregation protein SMC [Paraliomyxa miuraensis]MCX4245806.1 chromosome segregation protein SMC [Paraliomyxa miuraensis]